MNLNYEGQWVEKL